MKLCHLPLRPSTLSLLQKRGFVSTLEIETSKRSGGIANVAAELGCSLSEAASIVREVESTISSTSRQRHSTSDDGRMGQQTSTAATAASLLAQSKKSSSPRSIITFCRSIDTLLGGGMNLSEVTEVVGLPGVGKTQMAMQLCIDTRLSKEFGGVQGEAVYIDSEGSFSPERCLSMAQALVDHVQRNAERRQRNTSNQHQSKEQPSKKATLPEWFEPGKILDGIHVYRVHDEAAQTAVIQSLPTFFDERASRGTPVRLVVIDSIAFHYRCAPPGSDYMARTRSLATIAAFLSDLATQYDVAVVAINQMTTKVGAAVGPLVNGNANNNNANQSDSRLVPALGESWAHATTTRLLLSDGGGDIAGGTGAITRSCTLVKSPHKAAGTAFYQVTESGIRDIRTTVSAGSKVTNNPALLDASKRQRRH